jgi:hypothetical protein
MLYVCNFHVFFNDILDPEPTTRIKVSKLPDYVTEDVIRYFFENRRVSGGGIVDAVDYDKTTHTAVVIFEEADGLYLLFLHKPAWRYYPVEIKQSVFYQFYGT